MILKILGTITAIKLIYRFYNFLRELCLIENIKNTHDWVLITGGGGGIGLEFAKAFRKRGMKVFIMGHNTSKIAEKLGGAGKCESLEMDFNDITDPKTFENIEYIIKRKRWGYLINNVSYRIGSLHFEKMSMKEINKCITVGIYPIIKLTKLMLSLDSPPKIINVTAQNTFNTDLLNLTPSITLPFLNVYEGVNNFQQAFGESLLKEGINVLNIKPGAVKTKNTTRFLKHAEPLATDAKSFVSSAMKYIGEKGSYVVHWKHQIAEFLVNIFPFVKDCCFRRVGRDIAMSLDS